MKDVINDWKYLLALDKGVWMRDSVSTQRRMEALRLELISMSKRRIYMMRELVGARLAPHVIFIETCDQSNSLVWEKITIGQVGTKLLSSS